MKNELIARIRTGMATEQDARMVEDLIERISRYEFTLAVIASGGPCRNSWMAARALAGVGVGVNRQSWPMPIQGLCHASDA